MIRLRADGDGSVWITFNGETFNFEELRTGLEARGHRFRTKSDTEVIVHLYEDYGDQFVDHLNGMFAIALWDEPRQRLVLVRDRMGQKPLYWTRLGEGIAFASEPKSLLAHPRVPGTLDPRSLCRYLFYEYVPAPWSIYTGIHKLEAAHRLVYESGSIRIDRYWKPAAMGSQAPAPSLDEAAELLWGRFQEAVRSQLATRCSTR